MTFFVSLSDYKPASANASLPTPQDWLAAQWAARYPELPGLDVLLRQRRLTLLLDALNEIPVAGAEPVQLWKEFLRQLERDLSGESGGVLLPPSGLQRHPVVQRTSRAAGAHRALVRMRRCRSLSRSTARTMARRCGRTSKDTPQLDLLRSPYYLKLLVAQTTAGEIPAGRAALFTGFVRQALRREVEGDNALFQPMVPCCTSATCSASVRAPHLAAVRAARARYPDPEVERVGLSDAIAAGGERGGAGAHPL